MAFQENELDVRLERFDSSWRNGELPDVEDFLPTEELRLRHVGQMGDFLAELVMIDLEYRWRWSKDKKATDRGGANPSLPSRPRVEDYAHAFPHVGRPERLLVKLLASEYRTRHRWGDRPSHAEFFRRFPNLEPALSRALLEVDRRLPRSSPNTGLQVRCPHCHSSIQAEDADLSARIDCPLCERGFELLSGETWIPGQRMGEFELTSRLGAGSFGTVWKARDSRLQRWVALKIPHRNQVQPADVEQFLREARAAAQLKHPNIVSVHEVGRCDDTVFIVSDFVDGTPLSNVMQERRFSQCEAARLCQTIALSLDHAHRADVVHRDVTPHNIILATGETPYLTDFGLARRMTNEVTITCDGQLLGTPAYMSPEQAQGESSRVDSRTDIYSLGVILYELLTGELPFRGSIRMLIGQVISDEPPRPRRNNSQIDSDIETICLKCLEKNPAQRYESARELADDLGRFLRHEPIKARSISWSTRTWRWCQRNPLPANLLTALVLAIVVGFASVTALWIRAAKEAQGAKRARDEKQQQAVELALQRGQDLCLQGKIDAGMLWLARSLELGPTAAVDRSIRVNIAQWHANMYSLKQSLPRRRRLSSVAFSRDGNLIATGGKDSGAQIWEARTSQLMVRRIAEEESIRALAFSPDNHLLAIERDQHTVEFWDGLTGEAVGPRMHHPSPVLSISFSPDGEAVVTACYDGTAWLWNVESGEPIGVPLTHADRIHAVDFSPNGKLVLTGSIDKTARLWNAQSGAPMSDPLHHEEAVWAVTFSSDGSRFATGGDFGAVHIWDCATKERLMNIGQFDRVLALDFNSSDSLMAVGSTDRASISEARTGRMIQEFSIHTGDVISVAFTQDGQQLLTASTDGKVAVWAAETSDVGAHLFEHGNDVWSVAFSPDGSHILTGGVGSIRLWDVARMKVHSACAVTGPDGRTKTVGAVDFSPDGQTVVVSENSTVHLRQVPSLETIGQPMEHDDWVSAVEFCPPNGSRVLSASFDQTVKLWNAQTGAFLAALNHPDSVRAATFRPNDGSLILTGALDNTARLWSTETLQPARKTCRQQGMITAVDFSRDGNLFATGSSEGVVKIWNTHTCEAVGGPLVHDGRVNAVAFSGDGAFVATGTTTGGLQYWDWQRRRRIPLPRWHNRSVYDVEFSPKGARLLSGSWDGTVRLWDAPLGPVEDEVSRLVLWVQVLTGLELDQTGMIHDVDRSTWVDRHRRLQTLGESLLP